MKATRPVAWMTVQKLLKDITLQDVPVWLKIALHISPCGCENWFFFSLRSQLFVSSSAKFCKLQYVYHLHHDHTIFVIDFTVFHLALAKLYNLWPPIFLFPTVKIYVHNVLAVHRHASKVTRLMKLYDRLCDPLQACSMTEIATKQCLMAGGTPGLSMARPSLSITQWIIETYWTAL